MTRTLAIDLGGTNLRAALHDGDVRAMRVLTREAAPTTLDGFLARIRAVATEAGDIAAIGFDLYCQMLERAVQELKGEPVKLTAQEYKLLSYLMHHKGKVVSRTELIEHIYDQDFDRDSNTIEVFVTRIRKKLGAEVITTIRGLGYSLDDPADQPRA